MRTEEIKYLIDKMSMGKLDIIVKDFREGFWINPLNNMWITQRVYVSVKSNETINNKILSEIVSRVNSKSLKFNKEVCLKNK